MDAFSEDPEAAAISAGLHYVSDALPGICRRRAGKGFTYRKPDGGAVSKATLARIRGLAIPPAWTEVWITSDPRGHLQATGRDAKGRKQHLYHADYRSVREATKFARLASFARCLPRIRRRGRRHMTLPGLPRDKVLGLTVHLLEATLIRVGNASYARANKSFGLTTLRDRHLAIRGAELRFSFTGKSGRTWTLSLQDRRVAAILRACQELPGQELLQYRDDNGRVQKITSTDVNAYLRALTGENITAKDFRTWAATVLATQALYSLHALADVASPAPGPTPSRPQLRQMLLAVARRLGNTPSICRQCYIHPAVLACFTEPAAFAASRQAMNRPAEKTNGLRRAENQALALLSMKLPAAPPRSACRPTLRNSRGTARVAVGSADRITA
jgi:DNA topoisomerase-1